MNKRTKEKGEIDMRENILTVIIIIVIIIVLSLLIVGFYFFNKTLSEENIINDTNISSVDVTPNIVNNSITETTVEDETSYILQQIVDKFNSCSVTQQLRSINYDVKASTSDNQIIVFCAGDGQTSLIKFTYNNNILSTEIPVRSVKSMLTVADTLLALDLVDCIGQLKGFPERTITNALSGETVPTYTLENDGLEIVAVENNSKIRIRVDLTSNFPSL